MLYKKNYFSALLKSLSTRSERAAQGLLRLGSPQLRQFIHDQLTSQPGTNGAWLADPVFEPTFGWEESIETMGSLAGSSLLHRRLAEAMSSPPKELADEYTFPHDRHLFTHQLAAWEVLNQKEAQSLVVTSGTGSGKTECFLVPILNHLAQEIDAGEDLEGVRALFIYPLNALINSQQSRLDAWTDGFGGQIRHCLYTGALENERPARERKYNGQVIDRASLRDNPPQLLVTNATMLEYMLVRREDEPILKKSAGKLRWIILDEAHTHIGSQAAEMALLLRRVMLAFDVKPEDIRFVATSATFGSDTQTIESLRTFLADIAGIEPNQVHVVQGHRDTPRLVKPERNLDTDNAEIIAEIESDQELSPARYKQLEASKTARKIRSLFVSEGQAKAQTLQALQAASGLKPGEVLAWLDLMSGTKNAEGISFLPLRGHLFHNTIPAVRACVDRNCTYKHGTALDHPDWPFGLVYLEEQSLCKCGAPLLVLVSCEECNESFLQADETSSGRIVDSTLKQQIDEFSLESEVTDNDDQELEEVVLDRLTLIVNRELNDCCTEFFDKDSQRLVDEKSEENIQLQIFRSQSNECPCCHFSSRGLLRPARLGAPFTLSTVISTLLEFCPTDPEPNGKPFQGRKLISFTDSRQGTARIAAKLQQDSERNRIRGLVYQHLVSLKTQEGMSEEDVHDLNNLVEKDKSGKISKFEKNYLRKLLEENQQALNQAETSWKDMIDYLSATTDLQRNILDYYHDLAPSTFGHQSSVALANMLLAREFYRRPKRANNLETMGLIKLSYPGLETINEKPTAWPNNLGVESWHAFLKLILDFFVRENTALNFADENWLSLIGARVRPKWIQSPRHNHDGNLPWGFIRWPSVNQGNRTQPRAVLLLCKAFNWSTETHHDQIDSILLEAWDKLVQAQLLTLFGEGYRMSLEKISFSLTNEAYFCPVARRFIDTPFEQLSPYTPRSDRAKIIKVTPYKIPHLPESFSHDSTGDQRLLSIRDWVNNHPEIKHLRKEGHWSDVTDLVLEGGNYFRAAEHSAQQPKQKLDQYESQFKEGELNLLSCSTTMEMGVDIGGISVVAMSNTPPHPANYLQRAGRAGRRREGRSLALSVCKNTPHDQGVFRNPLWPFTTPMHMPKVSLQSPELVQRHVNAWLLSYWLKQVLNREQVRSMTSGSFFLKDEESSSLSARFALWCSNQSGEAGEEITTAIRSITRRSILELTPYAELLKRVVDRLSVVSSEWLKEHEATKAQLEKVGDGRAAASRAIKAQLSRMEDEYLLGELADKKFLPGYGFPTDVVSFDNRCMRTLKNQRGSQREDNRALHRSLASRDRITGLREYAPGAELVIDGLVYKSGGITLNWHIPAAADGVNELQLFKKAWRCTHCGTSSSAVNPGLEINCEECGMPIEQQNIYEYLVPSGFAVDFFQEPHNNISQLQYIPVQAPWLSVPASWITLVNPALGQFRASQQARLFNYTAGANDKGFAVCLECGKAEPMLSNADTTAPANEQYLPITFRQGERHHRLRGGRNDDGDNICPGSHDSWKIKQNIRLGHDSLTDALELVLRNPETGELLQDDMIGYSIAVALRESIAAELGVQAEELGCDCRPVKIDGVTASSIRIYDLRSGGYTTQAAEHLSEPMLWQRAIKLLENCDCAHACQRCLLSFDTRFEVDRLDRHAALSWINHSWLKKLSLPQELAVFGADSRTEITTMQEAVQREITKTDSKKTIGVYLHGSAECWDLAIARRFRHQIHNWINAGHHVQLHMTKSNFAALVTEQKHWLAKIAFSGAEICLHATFPVLEPLTLNITVESKEMRLAWASDNTELDAPDQNWDLSDAGSLIVRGKAPNNITVERILTNAELMPTAEPGVIKHELHDELDGVIGSFGKRFWQHLGKNATGIFQQVLDGSDPIVKVIYSDRYVRSPYVVNLLVNSLHELRELNGASFQVEIFGREYEKKGETRQPWQCWHDWHSSGERDYAIKEALDYCGFDSKVSSLIKLAHSRQLKLGLKSGKILTLQLDQGFSFWQTSRAEKRYLLKFDFSPGEIGKKIISSMNCHVEASPYDNTQIFISVSDGELE